MSRAVAVAFALCAPSPLVAQEIAAFGLAGAPKILALGEHYGGGISLAGFVPSSGIFGKDAQPLADSRSHIGLRAAYSVLTVRESGELYTPPCPPPGCTFVGANRRIDAIQIALLVRPIHSRNTRFDVGAGTNFFSVRGMDEKEFGFLATLGWSRRVARSAWLAFSYDIHGQLFETYVADGPNTNYARHLFRAGLSYDLRRRD